MDFQYQLGSSSLDEKKYKFFNSKREVRKFDTPLTLVVPGCTLIAILNKHHIHTSLLRLIFRCEGEDRGNFIDFLGRIWNLLPVGDLPINFTPKFSLNVGRYLDATFDSYGKQGSLESVKKDGVTLTVGQTNLTVIFQIMGTNVRGFESRLVSVEDSEGVVWKVE